MKKFIYLVVLLFTLAIASCKKSYLDINTNPNSPTEESITPQLILPQALNATARNTGAGYASVARWMGYWTRGGDYGPSTEEESYNITTGYGTGGWSSWYDNLYDYDVMERKANAAGQKFYEGIAKAMKTIGFQYLVDTYNNVPYSKAFKIDSDILPAYDKGADIYKDLFVQLDNASALIAADQPGQSPGLASADIMFKGDAAKWQKFINTLRLRLLIHLSGVPTLVDRAAVVAKINANGGQFLGAGETAQVDPGYKKANNAAGVSQQNPFWDTYEMDINGVLLDRYNRANNYVLNLFTNNADIRYQYFFDRAVTPIGTNIYFGYDYGFVDPNPNNPKSPNSSGVGGPGLAKSFTQPQWLLTSVESLFLQAEAIQSGLIAGDAQSKYNAAITESFVWLGVTNAVTTANAYINSTLRIVTWPTAVTTDPADPDFGLTLAQRQLKRIYAQKYLALTGVNNFEAWVDFRRVNTITSTGAGSTGLYPQIPLSLSPSRGTNHIPLRYRYPQSEYNYNATNVAAENNPDPQTSPIFWDAN